MKEKEIALLVEIWKKNTTKLNILYVNIASKSGQIQPYPTIYYIWFEASTLFVRHFFSLIMFHCLIKMRKVLNAA